MPIVTGCCLQKLKHLELALSAAESGLESAQAELSRDEGIFADKIKEIHELRRAVAGLQDDKAQLQEATGKQLQQLQQELQRWAV